MSRTHLVLVPGFGGFDAFGELRYYAGITRLLDAWRGGDGAFPDGTHEPAVWTVAPPDVRGALVLHYFDNHPTAGVGTRARLLRQWLAKRLARGEIGPSDVVTLVGHSTGGLDIRALLELFRADPADAEDVDGTPGAVTNATLAGLVRRVVFLSTPQHGTNIADFVRDNHWLLRLLLVGMQHGVRVGSSLPLAWVVERLADALPVGLGPLAADTVEDLADRHARPWRLWRDPTSDEAVEIAGAQEAYADVQLWLDRAQTDFLALDTLAVVRGAAAAPLLSCVPDEVDALTFATLGRDVSSTLPQGGPRRLLDVLRVVATRDGQSDALYRLAWAITCVGPFVVRGSACRPAQPLREVLSGREVRLEPHHNDGIANTAGMIWANEPVRIVPGDHGDIMGHFARSPEPPAPLGPLDVHGRYDLFVSGSGFTERHFVRVWREVFDFAARV